MSDDKIPNHWYRSTSQGKECTNDTHCESCAIDGDCDRCGTIDGRFMEAVNEYASTCDLCAELTHHDNLTMDMETQLGYCGECIPKLPQEILNRLDKK